MWVKVGFALDGASGEGALGEGGTDAVVLDVLLKLSEKYDMFIKSTKGLLNLYCTNQHKMWELYPPQKPLCRYAGSVCWVD